MTQAKLRDRPLSPHLQIYRWTWTMAMSIVHRATGGALYCRHHPGRGLALEPGLRPGGLCPGAMVFRLAHRPPHAVRLHLDSHAAYRRRHPPSDLGLRLRHGKSGTRMTMARATPIAAVALTLLIWIMAIWSAEATSSLIPHPWFTPLSRGADRWSITGRTPASRCAPRWRA